MNKHLRKTSIVCTIGPSSEDIIDQMLKAGMNVARINFSHGGPEEQGEKVEKFKKVRDELGVSASLMLDTQGPEIRLGTFDESLGGKVVMEEGQEVILVNTGVPADGTRFPISYKNLYQDVKKGSLILIDDGAIHLQVEKIENEEIITKVVVGGVVKPRKSINAPGTILKLPALKEKDINDILYGIKAGFDYIAASFTRNKEDVQAIRKLLNENGGQDIKIIAKIENQEGIDKIDEILEAADGIMVARGDLAVEIPFEEVPLYQKDLIKKANNAGKPVIIATQMLESMTEKPMPTRAEASDVANAVFDRTSAIMLSGESAVGKYPIECVKTMSRIAKNVEGKIHYWGRIHKKDGHLGSLEDKTAYVAIQTAKRIGADAILAYTHTGSSVKKIAGWGPECPIFVITDNLKTYNQLALVWDVMPIYIENKESIDEIIEEGIERLKESNILEEGDTIFITGGKDFLKNATESKKIGAVAVI